ncbi:MAG: hypothetical protein DI615_02435 [Gardnerella vaginalis]|nr:MAG: hypothetical protein DI615_02435 [Gardnerella vaginalis]PZP11189.1 MAG: hypothetical protein DI614_02435 [Gardnerella vaginalis]
MHFSFFFLCEANKKAPKSHLVFYEVVFSTFLVPFSAGVGVLIINELQTQKGTKKGRKGTKTGEKRNQKGGNGTFQEQKKKTFLFISPFIFLYLQRKLKIQLYGTRKRAYFTS